MTDGFRIEKLRRDHSIDGFTCGSAELDRFLIVYAFGNQQANASQTWLGLHGSNIVGFYTLVVGDVAYAGAPELLTKGLARHPASIMLLARLAVSVSWQGRKPGGGLLKDAMRRTFQTADIAGIRAFVVHVKDAASRRFHEHFGFAPSPTDPLHLYLLLRDLRQVANACNMW